MPVVVVLVVVVRWCRWCLAGGDTPLSTPRVGTIRGFGMQKFFFEFRVTWNVAAMNEGRVCWLYSLRQSVEFVLIE